MRQSRIRGTGLSYYHVISRVVDRRFILGEVERTHFVVLMRKLEAFLGLRVVTYVVMSNHFHLLVEEPDRNERPALDRETLLQKLGFLYERSTVDTVREELDRAAASGDLQWEQQIIERYQRRMGDLSIFMKELKQRFSSWYNRRVGRRGTLWEERYTSLLVEGDEKERGQGTKTVLTTSDDAASFLSCRAKSASNTREPSTTSWRGAIAATTSLPPRMGRTRNFFQDTRRVLSTERHPCLGLGPDRQSRSPLDRDSGSESWRGHGLAPEHLHPTLQRAPSLMG